MTPGSQDPFRTHAARALLGESVGIVTGMTFVPLSLLEQMGWGDGADPAGLLAAAARRLSLDFAFVPAAETWAEEATRVLVAEGVAALWVVDGPFSRAAIALGWTEAIRLSIAQPYTLADVLDEGRDVADAAVSRGFAAGASALVVAEDLAGAAGPLIAPDFVNEELMPRIGTLVGHAKREGRPSVLHSDGDLRVFVPAIKRAGLSAVHGGGPDEASFVALLREARRYGLKVVGGIGGASLARGEGAAEHAGMQAALLSLPGDVLVADDGGIVEIEELAGFAQALKAACSGVG
jgi:hypothetical protein